MSFFYSLVCRACVCIACDCRIWEMLFSNEFVSGTSFNIFCKSRISLLRLAAGIFWLLVLDL